MAKTSKDKIIKDKFNVKNEIISKMMFEPTDRKSYVDMVYKKEDKIASKFLEMYFIELPKYRKKMPEMKTKLDEWMYFFLERRRG